MEGSLAEPWGTFFLLTLFLLYIILAGSVSVSSFLPDKSPSSEALRRVTLPVAILLMYNYGIRFWSVLPSDMVWLAWVFFSAITAGSIFIAALYLKYGLQEPEQTKAPTTGKGLKECLLKRTVSAIV